MKTIVLLFFVMAQLAVTAQWTNTSNQFYDSLHMTVTNSLQAQQIPLVLKSYPDSGYFIIWQDERNSATTKTDIYAQKYDKTGKRLWTLNGVPVTRGPNAQYFAFNSNQDYRNRSFAATDSAGGFYICYTDDSIKQYTWNRIVVQHMRSNGTAVFGGAGYIVAATPSGEGFNLSAPLLIADGNKGFFVSFVKTYYTNLVYVHNYRDENGALKYYGGDIVNRNASQRFRLNACGIQAYIDYTEPNIGDYNIWSDGQGGCNIIMSMSINDGSGTKLAFNRLWRAKKDAKVKRLVRNTTGVACPQVLEYKKGNVYLLYQLQTYFTETMCRDLSDNLYVVTNNFVTSNGYHVIDAGAYDYTYPKGVTLPTAGNINIDMIAVGRRKYENNTLSDHTVQGYCYKVEKFDTIPYQRTSYDDPDFGYNTLEPPLDTFNAFKDTLLASGIYYPDFCLAAGGNHFYIASLMSSTGTIRQVRLQNLDLLQVRTDSFYLQYRAPKAGIAIGSELSTGFTGTDIFYDFPLITVTRAGLAVFSIKERGGFTRISPLSGTELTWGAMGRPVGTGIYQYHYYDNDQPVVALDPANGTGIVAWRDARYIPPTNTGSDIYMRQLSNLGTLHYKPPIKPVRKVPNPYGATESNPAILYGTSGETTLIESGSISYEPSTTTLAAIMDNYNFGRVQVFIQQNSAAIRKYNDQPYLDRNLTFVTQITPAGMNADMFLYFTKEEFNALKTADNTINTPGDLSVINQPLVPNNVPTVYEPVAGEKLITPYSWDSISGGYYLLLKTARFGNFFILKGPTVRLCPGSSTTLTSDITGSSYQWQQNIGLGYYNISNDANTSGVKTATLQLNNIPSSWYGYKFRCMIDGTKPGKEFTLQFLNAWSGAINGDWSNPANWSCGAVPDTNTDVIINSGSVVVNTNATCRTLTVKPGAGVTVKTGYSLTISK